MNGKEVTKAVITRQKKGRRFPKMSTEAETVLQEIRAIDSKPCEIAADNKYPELNIDLLFPQVTKEANNKMSERCQSYSSTHQHPPNEAVTQAEGLPFVITFPGFDIRYNLTALRPQRESAGERERNVYIQRKSIAKCKEWLKRC